VLICCTTTPRHQVGTAFDRHPRHQPVNFWICILRYQFAPRYRDCTRKWTLWSVPATGQYEDFLINLRKVYSDLIEKEWPNIQRIMASLAERCDAGHIVRKLGSYTRQNQTRSLVELEISAGRFTSSISLTMYIRQCVQKALNRGEAYHRYAVRCLRQWWETRVQTEAEQQIWNECSRLIPMRSSITTRYVIASV